ncbi:MAG: oxidoreductase [Sporolactobacillus sp.]|jgi:hypothetical protein|nr:oxidoreductase [Sporolactobacillus sp.]
MKHFILWTAVLMAVALIAVTVYYQASDRVAGSIRFLFKQNHPRSAPAKTSLQPATPGMISYTLQNDKLRITYNKGRKWMSVPVDTERLFGGEYNGNKQELIDGSYLLTKKRAVFLSEQTTDQNETKLVLTISEDRGKTWRRATVTRAAPGIRFRNIGFPNSRFGYVIVSGDRTMSTEGTYIFLTVDGGKTWEKTASPPTSQLVADGGFVDASTGFVSYGTISPNHPHLYVTQDGGHHWRLAKIYMPAKYWKVFVRAETPKREGNHLAMRVDQGDEGDYKGNKVNGKFISKDRGRTWTFSKEVRADESE